MEPHSPALGEPASSDVMSKLVPCQPTTSPQRAAEIQQQNDLEEIARICDRRDFYEILGVTKTNSAAEIQKAYKRLALRFHPDKCKLTDAGKAFQAIGEAYTVLRDPDLRSKYDLGGAPGGTDVSDAPSQTNHRPTMSAEELFTTVFTGYSDPSKMTMSEVIRNNYVRLESKLDGNALCSSLLQKHLIRHLTYEKYQTEVYPQNVRTLLSTLMKRPKYDVPKFLEALLETRQEHLILQEQGEKNKDEMLLQFRVQWEQELNPEALGPHLCPEGILTVRDFDQFSYLKSRQDRNRFLIDKLRCSPVPVFQTFCELLSSVPRAMLPAEECLQIGYSPFHGVNQQELEEKPLTGCGVDTMNIATDLRQLYSEQLKDTPLVPWEVHHNHGVLDKFYSQLSLVKKQPRGGQTAWKDLERTPVNNLCDIFQPFSGDKKPPRRILLVGLPGVGKTTTINKLAAEWTEKTNKEFRVLYQYKAVFVIRLHAVKTGASITDIIRDQDMPCDSSVDSTKLNTLLQSEPENVMFCLDGYDEYQGNSQECNELIENKRLLKATVVMTTRPNRMPLSSFQRLVEIEGFNQENQKKFMERYFNEESGNHSPEIEVCDSDDSYDEVDGFVCSSETKGKADDLVKEIRSKNLEHLAQIPLLLFVICSLFDHSRSIPGTLAFLYRELVGFLYDRQTDKSTLCSLEKILLETGQMALTHMSSGELEFDISSENEGVNCAIKIGILRPAFSKTGITRKGRQNVCFLHNTVKEFCVAWCLIHDEDKAQELVHICKGADKVLDLTNVLEFACELTGNRGGADSIVDTGDVTSSGRCQEMSAKAESVLNALNTKMVKEVRIRHWTIGELYCGDTVYLRVWNLLVKCYHLLGKSAFTSPQGLTGQWFKYRVFDSKSMSQWEEEVKICQSSEIAPTPLKPVIVSITGYGSTATGSTSLYLSGRTSPGHLTAHRGGWDGPVMFTIDVSQLSFLMLWKVSLDTQGMEILLHAPLRVMWMRIIDMKQESGESKIKRWHAPFRLLKYVTLIDIDFTPGAAKMVAASVTASPHLQHLNLTGISFSGTEAIWAHAAPPKHIVTLNLEDLPCKELMQWAMRRHLRQRLLRTLLCGSRADSGPIQVKEVAWDRFQTERYVGISSLIITKDMWPDT